MNGGSGAAAKMDGSRLLGVAEKLLNARDLVGSKKFAELAMESEPLLEGVDWVLAASDVLLAAGRRRVNHHVDWYEVLQLGPSPEDHDISAVRRQYRRLALLLRPNSRPPSDAAEEASKIVGNAWAVLSDLVKKELYDKELLIAASTEQTAGGGGAAATAAESRQAPSDSGANGGTSFWTACSNCFYLHQYARGYEGRTLICQNCRRPFPATELAHPPPIVPGSDLYYCAWGLFPLGFPGHSNFAAGAPKMASPAEGTPWNSPFFPGFCPDPFAAHRTGEWAEGECNGAPAAEVGGGGQKKMKRSFAAVKENEDMWSSGKNQNQNQNQSLPRTTPASQKASREMRKKVMARRPRKHPPAGAAAPFTEAEVAVDPRDKDDMEVREELGSNHGSARKDIVHRSKPSPPSLKVEEIVAVDRI
ncbi:unnamed protein product [Spirodela intermedia]|uniref:J domain-containing protein n=1 Tax=Spirodela intermedia TaxID=51605 RepID=A0A7I8JVP2_SPIIN|nr:unnamed protein product [Spirodela intermedia]